jgi:cytoskeleton protein RodZ
MSSQEPDDSGVGQPVDSAALPEPDALAGRPGAQLLAERREQGLSLGDVARQLKLSVRQVEALERDEYAAFPGPVFVRGFLRNYAKLLQLDPQALVAQADIAAAPSTGSPAIASVPVPLHESGASRRGRFGFGTLALGLVLIIVVLATLYDARNKPAQVSLAPVPATPSAAARSPEHADSPPPASTVTSVSPPSVPAASANTSNATAQGSPPASTTQAAAAVPAAAVPAPAAATVPAAAEVTLDFDAESWVEVKDRSGALIFSRLSPAGAQQVVSGEPPLDLVIGNAQSVRLTYRGKPVDLAPHTRVDVARVRLE